MDPIQFTSNKTKQILTNHYRRTTGIKQTPWNPDYNCCNKDTDHQGNHSTEKKNQRAIARLSTRDTYFWLIRCDHVRADRRRRLRNVQGKVCVGAEKPVISVQRRLAKLVGRRPPPLPPRYLRPCIVYIVSITILHTLHYRWYSKVCISS